jgi:Flp pilus assembly pilin Flp
MTRQARKLPPHRLTMRGSEIVLRGLRECRPAVLVSSIAKDIRPTEQFRDDDLHPPRVLMGALRTAWAVRVGFRAWRRSDSWEDKMYRFLRQEHGQDLIEYTLLLALIALAGTAAFVGMGRSISSIWTVVNNRLASAAGG